MADNRTKTEGAAKQLARKLRGMGLRRPVLMDGGFTQWAKDELPVEYNTAM